MSHPGDQATGDFSGCEWLNEPPAWRLTADTLSVVTGPSTDFWRETHYGFTRHSGHFYGHRVVGDFTASVRVRANFEHLYDQAGLMVRIDDSRWVKAGIEYSNSDALLSSVLTLGQSDWATAKYGADATDFWIRVTVSDRVLRLQSSCDGITWPLLRLSHFPQAQEYFVGPMCCTPERAGLEVKFSNIVVSVPNGKALHDLT